jgi:hypothetical protein
MARFAWFLHLVVAAAHSVYAKSYLECGMSIEKMEDDMDYHFDTAWNHLHEYHDLRAYDEWRTGVQDY